MNKLVLALATVAALGLSTAAFAENPAVPTSTATQKEATLSKAPAHKMRASHRQMRVSHRLGAKDQTLHHKVTRHYGNNHGKRVAVKHLPAKKTVSTKTAS
jgi:hypothetical protein